jgi:Spy/CpxP family protein refolding chaperone
MPGTAGELTLLSLPASWWREPRVAEPLHLNGDQVQRLDALEPQAEEVSRLERDSMMALRELRTSLDASNATAAGIVAAGAHIREMRDSLLQHQITLLAAQREILTADQWTHLQHQLAEQRRPEPGEYGRGMGRSRGPGGRGGRRPSW